MDTVEVPDGQRDRSVGDRGQAADETHVRGCRAWQRDVT
jgi:hypothetical protein